MMGRLAGQTEPIRRFRLDDNMPDNHLLRRISALLDFESQPLRYQQPQGRGRRCDRLPSHFWFGLITRTVRRSLSIEVTEIANRVRMTGDTRIDVGGGDPHGHSSSGQRQQVAH